MVTVTFGIWVTGVDHGDNLWRLRSLAGDKMYSFGDKMETKESVISVHGTFPLKTVFLRQRQQQKKRLVSETLKTAVCPKLLALSATGHLGKWSWPRPPSTLGSFLSSPRETGVEKFEKLCFTKSPLSLMALVMEVGKHAWFLLSWAAFHWCPPMTMACPLAGRVFAAEGSLDRMSSVVSAQEAHVVWFARQN